MSIKTWLASSLAANVAMAGLIAVQFVRTNNTAEPKSVRIEGPIASVSTTTTSEQEKILALATLEADLRVANPPPRLEFWNAGDEAAMLAYEQKIDDQLEVARKALIGRFGSGAVDAPVFSRLFRPLNVRYPYLGSKSQLALAKLQRTRRVASFTAAAVTASPDPAAAYQAEQDFNASLKKVFTPAEYSEYQLHQSIAARQLRSSGVVANEKEFRAAFEALQHMDADRSAAGYVAGQDELRAILGPERYITFSASRDPQFAAIERMAAMHRLTREQALGVYGVILDGQVELVRAGAAQRAGAARVSLDPQQVFAERDRRVASLVCDQVAHDILQAYSNSAIPAGLRTAQVQ